MKQRFNLAFSFLMFLVLAVPAYVAAEEQYRGRIVKVNGDVQIVNERGEARRAEESKFMVREMDTVITKDGGQAVVQFTDGALTVLDEKSSLRVEKTSWLSHVGGKIYFTFKKLFGKPRKVETKFATIGIRGTTFIVYDDESGEGVALQEGRLVVESPGDDYELHRQKEMDEFEAFKQQARERQQAMRREYDDYKQKMMQEFVEYRRSFTLEANRVIRFDGNRVDETEMTEEVKAEFDDFEAIAGEMLIEFRQKAKTHRDRLENEREPIDEFE